MPKSKPTMVRPFFLFLRNKPMKHNREPSPHRPKLTMLRIGTQQITRPIKDRIKPAMPRPFFLLVTAKVSSMFLSLITCRAQLLMSVYVFNRAKINHNSLFPTFFDFFSPIPPPIYTILRPFVAHLPLYFVILRPLSNNPKNEQRLIHL